MYSDYPVAYESNVNQYMIYWIILGALLVIALIVIFISLAKVFKKANRSSISAWIPFYNLYTYVEITHMPKIYFLLSLIPLVNVPFIVRMISELAKYFKKSQIFSLGLIFLPFIFYPILAFGDSEYVGINLTAMEGKTTVEDIPEIDLLKNQKIEVEVNDQEDKNVNKMNISLGGGVYKSKANKDLSDEVKKDLLKVEKKPVAEETTSSSTQAKVNQTVNINDPFSVAYISSKTPQPQQQANQPVQQPINQQVTNQNPQQVNNQQPTPKLEYKTCPNCKSRVKSDSPTCFICGNRFM